MMFVGRYPSDHGEKEACLCVVVCLFVYGRYFAGGVSEQARGKTHFMCVCNVYGLVCVFVSDLLRAAYLEKEACVWA